MTRTELLEFFAKKNSENKFGAKLDFTQRCEILALRHAGVTREVLADMYKVDRRTITHIYNPLSPHYKNVREKELQMGRDNFRDTYASDDLLQTAKSHMFAIENKEENNKLANAKRGLHIVRGKMCKYDHRVVIDWQESGVQEPGWYYRDLDSDFPDNWFAAGDESSMRNSQACYSAMLNEITDRIE